MVSNDVCAGRWTARLGRWLRTEPMVHFIGLGVVIFAVYGLFSPVDLRADSRIEITVQDLQRLHDLSVKQWGQEPNAQTLHGLVQAYVREEVLYREARAQGLDRDDVIVRRRLAQKMEFIANQDMGAIDDSALLAYYREHPAQYSSSEQLDFEQRFFAPKHRAVASLALSSLRAGQAVAGDPSMLAARSNGQDLEQVQKDYGAAFAQSLFALATRQWTGPLESAHGLHLVRVTRRTAPQVLPLEAVRARVLADASRQAVEKAREDAYASILARYTVTLPELPAAEVHLSLGEPSQAQP